MNFSKDLVTRSGRPTAFHLLLLDIGLAGENGVELATRPLDYLMKPMDERKLAKAIDWDLRTNYHPEQISLPVNGGLRKAGVKDILYAEAVDHAFADSDNDGAAFTLLDNITSSDTIDIDPGTITVAKCNRALQPFPNRNGTHTLECLYCGDTGGTVSCNYGEGYGSDAENHWQTCSVCGYIKEEAHTIGYTAEADGRVITVRRECATCGYEAELGTVTVTIPKLVYGDLSGVISADISGQLLEKMKVTLKVDEHHIRPLDAQYGNTLSDLAENEVLDVGEHTLRVAFILKESGEEFKSFDMTFTVDPIPPVGPKPPVDPDPGPDEPDPPAA